MAESDPEPLDVSVEHLIPSAASADSGLTTKLPPTLQHKYESAFGADFSSILIHQSSAPTLLNAEAFTKGDDIFIKHGAYHPHTSAGEKLVAHELTHVVQERRQG